jgi:hypothetical protein
MNHPLLPIVDRALHLLGQASLLLAQAAKWADRDRFSLNPAAFFAGPLKYWKWHKAKKAVAQAAAELETLRGMRKDIPESDQAVVEISKLDAINDIFEVFPFRTRMTGTPGGPSRFKQQVSFETTVLQQIETTRVGVDHLMSEVGLLHARLRGEASKLATS